MLLFFNHDGFAFAFFSSPKIDLKKAVKCMNFHCFIINISTYMYDYILIRGYPSGQVQTQLNYPILSSPDQQ